VRPRLHGAVPAQNKVVGLSISSDPLLYRLEEFEGTSFCVPELVKGEMRAKQLNSIPIPVENSLTPDFGSFKIEATKRRLRMKAGSIIKAAG